MSIAEAADLIRDVRPGPDQPQHWADLGCGTGIFSTALASLLPAGSMISCCDREQQIKSSLVSEVKLQFVLLDFEKEILNVAGLDGILMANSLHYVRSQQKTLLKWKELLKPGGKFIVIEYDTQASSPWVPHPVSFSKLNQLVDDSGMDSVRMLGTRKSRYGDFLLYACEVMV